MTVPSRLRAMSRFRHHEFAKRAAVFVLLPAAVIQGLARAVESSGAGGARGRAAACVIALLAAACSGASDPEGGSGAMRLAATGATGVAKVVATIGSGDGAYFPPITLSLGEDGPGWTAFVPSVPAGPGRRFELVAYDALDTPLYAGSATSDVAPGAVIGVAVVLQAYAAPPPPLSSAPVITAITASPGLVAPGGDVQLAASAWDPDSGPVRLAWTAACGAFSDASAATTTWTAPAVEGSCVIAVTASDDGGSSGTVYLRIDVQRPVP